MHSETEGRERLHIVHCTEPIEKLPKNEMKRKINEHEKYEKRTKSLIYSSIDRELRRWLEELPFDCARRPFDYLRHDRKPNRVCGLLHCGLNK